MRRFLLLSFGCLVVACGGTGGERLAASQSEGGAGPGPVDPCVAAEQYEFQLISDFETRRATSWWLSGDDTQEFMEPEEGNQSPATAVIEGGRCGKATQGLRLQIRGLKKYGGSFGYSYSTETPFDASEWDGVAFWVRRERASGETLFVGVNEKHTDESNGRFGWPVEADGQVTYQPYCLDDAPYERDKCDRFGVGIVMSEEWRFYALRFDAMRQRQYGVVAPFLDQSALYGLNAGFEVGDWDFWLDDVAYFRKK